MKTTTFTSIAVLFVALLLTACGSPESSALELETDTESVALASTQNMPGDFVSILDAHGGLDSWKEFRQLSYEMPRGEDNEYQLVDLYDRREHIRQPGRDGADPVEIGFDGQELWITADTTYKGNPKFYKNLMFYFYAMPWVLADPGINYTDAEPLVYDGVTYPGILVSYDDGIGFSPKDNYRLHYDAETKKMRWLGYTVTGRSGKTSDKFSWIEYPTWSDRDGVELADSLVWHVTENNLPTTEIRRSTAFNDVKISKVAAPDDAFARPEGARIIE